MFLASLFVPPIEAVCVSSWVTTDSFYGGYSNPTRSVVDLCVYDPTRSMERRYLSIALGCSEDRKGKKFNAEKGKKLAEKVLQGSYVTR